MPEVEIKDKNNNIVGKMESLNDEVFGVTAKEGVVHSAVVNYPREPEAGHPCYKDKGSGKRRRQEAMETEVYRQGKVGQHTFSVVERRRHCLRSSAKRLFL